MKNFKNIKNHLIIIVILVFIAGLAEGIVYFHFYELRESPIVLNNFLRIYPTYNRNGSWFHGRLGIGYVRWLLIFERIFILLVSFYLFRFMKAYSHFFHMSMLWLHITDFAFAVAIYRIVTSIRGVFTLDYLDFGRYIYDFPDLYLGMIMAGLLIWLIPALTKYYRFRNTKVKGLNFIKRQIWDFKFAAMFLKAALIPESRWEAEFELWR